MNPNDRDNVVICPKCKKLFCMAYVISHTCPFCGTPFDPIDTMAGCPIKDEESQLIYAKSILRD